MVCSLLPLFQHDCPIHRAVGGPVLASVGRAGGDLVGEGLFHSAVHLPPQLPGPIGRARPCGQHCPHPGRMGQLIPIAGGTDFQLAQQLLGDGTQAVLCNGDGTR